MKFISWNVNGLRAICGKGELHRFFEEAEADFCCLHDPTLQPGQRELEFRG